MGTVETVDYIAFTPSSVRGPENAMNPQRRAWEVRPVGVLDVPPKNTIGMGLPNCSIPSDHVFLLADYDIVPV
jgi:hypothetical protein